MASNYPGGIFGGLGYEPLGWDTMGAGAAPGAPSDASALLSKTTTKETDVTVGVDAGTTTKTTTEQTVAGGGIQEWFVRAAVVILGMIFVAVGLSMLHENIPFRFR